MILKRLKFSEDAVQGEKSSYLEEKLFQYSEKPEELCKTLKSLCLSFKEGKTSKILLNEDGAIQFEPCKSANIFKKSFSELATDQAK